MTVLQVLLCVLALNVILAMPFLLRAQAEFQRQGRWSRLTAIMSGCLMHGQALVIWALALIDRGSLFSTSSGALMAGVALFVSGGIVIALGRKAYGDVARVYGLREDELITHGIYKRTRNPQYLGYAMMFFGSVLASGSVLAVLATLMYLVFIHIFITRVEEPQMRRVFGQAFDDYAGMVRRYV